MKSFDDIDLGDGLKQNIRRCNYIKPTQVQRHSIPITVFSWDLMACAQIGSGKTNAFCFPIICGFSNDPSLGAGRGGIGNVVPCPLVVFPLFWLLPWSCLVR
ncbi:hypothetical protein V6N13_051069 [Hibiscus sabdariffa]|uniref:ATP-dependent RNA helicase n=1 Tax=Hibiscus sabdariffa TaxID=183260 RepID=A0ABR2T2R0_9ROSI